MIIAGKCPPEKDELRKASERGFEHVELYLEREHIDNYVRSLKACQNANIEVVSVHTPHAYPEETEYFRRAGDLAEELDAQLVFHSQYAHHYNIPQLEEIEIKAEYSYENNPGVSVYALENLILGRDHDLVLDTAHLYIGEQNFFSALKHLINQRNDRIKVVHLCDSTETTDGLGFGKGNMNIEKTCKTIAESKYDGIIVLEVMPEHQRDALEKWKKYTEQ